MTICLAAAVLSNIAAANITITPNDGINYTYQRWDFDTTVTRYGQSWGPFYAETDQNPFGSPVASTLNTYGTNAGWYDNRNGQDVMRSGANSYIHVILDIPNLSNPDYKKILQLEFAYQGASVDPIVSWMSPLGAVLVSTVKGKDSLNWDEMTYTWHITPQPASESILLYFYGGANGVDLNYIEVATVCVPEPATLVLLGLGSVMSLVSRKRRV